MTSKGCIRYCLLLILLQEESIYQMLIGLFNMTLPKTVTSLCIESVEQQEQVAVESL